MINEIFQLQNPWRKNPEYQIDLKGRIILETLIKNLNNELIIGLLGSRQVGKSSLINLLIKYLLSNGISSENIYYFNLDDMKLHELFASIPDFIEFIGKNNSTKYIFLDEIQRLPSPGLFLKEIHDLKLNYKIIYSGSSQLEIKSKVKEHLVGRVRVFEINRLSFQEVLDFSGPITRKEALNKILIYGSYPAVVKENDSLEKKLRIKDIYQSYVQKDLVDFLRIELIEDFNKLLILLAHQIGNLLNINSISNSLGVPHQTVKKYLSILEYSFICKRIFPFHKNYNKEITKTPKLYFLDNGLRNFILNSFNDLELRDDRGILFENFYFNELLANDHYSMNKINFWRTTNQTEIDFIITGDKKTEAVEVKWMSNKTPKILASFLSLYPDMETRVVTSKDYTG